MPHTNLIGALSLVCLLSVSGLQAVADDFIWTGGAGNETWSDPANWTNVTPGGTATFPRGDDNVSFPLDAKSSNGVAAMVEIEPDVTFSLSPGTLTVGGLTNDGRFGFAADASSTDETLAFTGDAVLAGTGEIVMKERFDSTLRVDSQTVTNAMGHTIRGAGKVSLLGVNPEFVNDGVFLVEGEFRINALGSSPATFTNNGLISVADGETFELPFIDRITLGPDSTLQTNATGVISVNRGTLSNATVNHAGEGTLLLKSTNLDTVTISAGSTVTFDIFTNRVVGTLTNNGTIEFAGSEPGGFLEGALAFTGDAVLAGTGEIVMKQNDHFFSAMRVDDQTVTNATGHTIRGAGLISLGARSVPGTSAEFVNDGTISVEDRLVIVERSLVNGAFKNNGIVNVADDGMLELRLIDTVVFGPASTIQTNTTGFVNVIAGTIANSTINISGEGMFLLIASQLDTVTITEGSTTTLSTSTNRVVGTLTNNGTVEFMGDERVANEVLGFTGDAVLAGTGEIVMKERSESIIRVGAQTVTNAASHTLRGTGNIDGSAGGWLVNNGAILGNTATDLIDINADLAGDGLLRNVTIGSMHSPGAPNIGQSTASVTIEGVYELRSGSQLLFEIGGPTAGDDFDQLVSSDATSTIEITASETTLGISLIEGYEPSIGDKFTLIDTAGTITGEFAQLALVGLPNLAFIWEVQYSTNQLVIELTETVPLPGDFNADGRVDLLDLDILGANFGSTTASGGDGDANGDGAIDLLDLDLLGSNFGVFAQAAAVAIPEPTALGLLVTALAISGESRRCGRTRK